MDPHVRSCYEMSSPIVGNRSLTVAAPMAFRAATVRERLLRLDGRFHNALNYCSSSIAFTSCRRNAAQSSTPNKES